MQNNQKKVHFHLNQVDFKNVDKKEFLQAFNEIFFRACSTITDAELELLQDFTKVGARLNYLIDDKFAELDY